VHDRRQGSHLAPVFRRGAFAAWWWLVVAVAGVVLVGAFRALEAGDLAAAGIGYALLATFVVLGELRPIVASEHTDPDGVNLGTAFLFAVLLQWGLPLALLTVLVATLIGEAVRRKRLYAAFYNVAQFTLAYGVAWAVLVSWGWTASPTAPAVLRPIDLAVIVVAGAAYHIVNLVLVGAAVGLAERRSTRAAITEGFWYHTITVGAVLALAPLVVLVLDVHWGFLPLLLLPLGTIWLASQMATDRERRATMDALTGVANRGRLADVVAERVAAAAGSDTVSAVVLLDLDRFKEVNDTLGHAAGDELLRAVAGRLTGAVRDGDLVARLGGDEFVVVLTVEDQAEAEAVTRRLAARIHEPFEVDGAHLEVEVSVGIAMLPEHGDDLDQLLRCADLAMYDAKRCGATVSLFRERLARSGAGRMQLLADLRRSLDTGELELRYQPQLAIAGGELIGLEALVRWRHPRFGLLLPGRFIHLAERSDAIRGLTVRVLDEALRALADWRAMGLEVPVAVNVSLHDLVDTAFVERVGAALDAHGVPAGSLRIEVTEESLVSDPVRVTETLRALGSLGVALSLDDFGTGHASITRLMRLPVGEVKIDRSFIADLVHGGGDDRAVVRSIIDLAGALSLRSIAEGVETQEQADVLAELGCDAIQGWHVSAAMDTVETTAYLRAHADRQTQPA
jgi:diguanylate cyclase (GGDEF)-like protein